MLLKKIALLAVLFLCVTCTYAQGVRFEQDMSWDGIMAKARTENKLIFMDAYTTWCGPCKMMSRNVFTDPEVASYYNTNFVNAKIDMEKGEGVELAARYNVVAYPTLLFIDPSGEVVHRVAGYHDVPGFLALGRTANNPELTIAGMDKKYNGGNREPEFMFKYMEAKADAGDPSYAFLANDYLRNQGDFGTDRNMEVIMRFVNDPFSDGFSYLQKNKAQFVKKYGAETVEQKLQGSVSEYFAAHPNLSLSDIEKVFLRVFGAKDGERMFAGYQPQYYRQQGKKEEYAKSTVQYFKKYPSNDAMELNEAALTFYRVIDDKKMLKSAVKWAKKSIKIDSQYFNNDTLAALLYKLGKLKEAQKVAEYAIGLAQKSNEDASETQKLLDTIKSEMK